MIEPDHAEYIIENNRKIVVTNKVAHWYYNDTEVRTPFKVQYVTKFSDNVVVFNLPNGLALLLYYGIITIIETNLRIHTYKDYGLWHGFYDDKNIWIVNFSFIIKVDGQNFSRFENINNNMNNQLKICTKVPKGIVTPYKEEYDYKYTGLDLLNLSNGGYGQRKNSIVYYTYINIKELVIDEFNQYRDIYMIQSEPYAYNLSAETFELVRDI